VGELGEVGGEQERAFLCEAAKIIEAPQPVFQIRSELAAKGPTPRESQASIARVRDALRRIANDGPPDWEWWNRIGMALWAVCGGDDDGLALWFEFSARHPDYSERLTRERWQHYHRSPPTSLGAGTLFREADQHDQRRLAGFLDLGIGL
jgi:hypothetical protein